MLLKSKLFRPILVVTLCLPLSVAAVFADTIRLKDGSVIKGKITNFGGGRFTVVIGDGARRRQMNFNAAEVDSISFDADSAVKTSNQNSGANDSDNSNAVQNSIPQNSAPKNNSTAAAPVLPNPAATTSDTAAAAVEQPITLNVKVSADNTSNGWTNSGFVLQKGQRVRITGSGRISLGGGRYAAPDGISSLPDAGKLMKNQATGGLIAVVGDDNNDFLFVGREREFVAARDGALFLGVNEENLSDNSGVFDVRIEIYPN